MKRSLFWWVIFYASGIYTCKMASLEAVLIFSLLFLAFSSVLLYFKPAFISAGLIFCCACFMLGGFHMEYKSTEEISSLKEFSGQTIELSVRVSDYPQKGKKYFTVYGKAERIKTDSGEYEISENCMLRLYDKECNFEPSDSILVKAKVLLPKASEKISDDYSLYLKTKKIYTILSVKGGNCTSVGQNKKNFAENFAVLRRNISLKIYEYLQNDEAALLGAMLLGDKSKLTEEITDNFSDSGISHIVAVSGLHVNMICAVFYALSAALGINKKHSYLVAAVLVFLYVPFTGMSVSAVRAGIMAIMFIIASLILRRADALTSLAFAALVILAENPFYAFSVSFMLSFGATLGILLYCEKLTGFFMRRVKIKRGRKLLGTFITSLSVTVSAQIITAPIIICYFGSFTFWSFITNLFVPHLMLPLFAGGGAMILTGFVFSPLAKFSKVLIYPILKVIIKISAYFAAMDKGIIKAQTDGKTILLYTLLMALIYLFLYTDEKYAKCDED